jgi:hypothetical protein
MAHSIIRRARIVEAFRRAVHLGASREEAYVTVGQSLGLDVHTVEWCVGEEEKQRGEGGRAHTKEGVSCG